MPRIRPLHQLTCREYETLKLMDVLEEIYPQATGEWAIDSRPPTPPGTGAAHASGGHGAEPRRVLEPAGQAVG